MWRGTPARARSRFGWRAAIAPLAVLGCALATGCGDGPSSETREVAQSGTRDEPPLAVGAGAARGPSAGASPRSSARPDETSDAQPWFEEVALAWGIDFVHQSGASAEKQLPETMGAGAALVDFDRDGDCDLYFVQSGPLPIGALARDRSGAPPNRLYLREGAGYRDATEQSGDAAHRGYGMGVAAGDVDGDGWVDLYLTNLGPDALLRGEEGAHFVDVSAAAGLGDPRWTTGALFFDPDADGDLDLYVLGYLDVDLEHPPWCGQREQGWRSYCHPDQFEGIADRYYQNDGRGRFVDSTRAAGLESNLGKGLGVASFDFDDDGALDLYVANDSVENRMWRGLGDGRFEDATLLTATGVNRNGATEAGMGVATGDVDGDGRTDLFVTNFDEESNTFYRNDGDGLFSDTTARSGLDAASRMPVGFGTVLCDFDLDGDLDLAVTNGHIVDNIELYNDGKTYAQRSQLFENQGQGRFRERRASALGTEPLVGRGLYQGDLDGDGRPDLVLTQCGAAARVFHNRSGAATPPAEERVELEGAPTGSRFWARYDSGLELVRDAGPQTSYLGSSSARLSLTLRGRKLAALSVRVPGGERVALALPARSGLWRLLPGPGGWRLVGG